ncbi:CMP/dCMP deaminase zinc-binding protein [Rhizobium leguminosarum bv. phaseoli CCGM1]|nr:CMP/dCMP deaminase zinc-binding protein [Rhizobium leguminosarum bv. phaseoli CCGM1]
MFAARRERFHWHARTRVTVVGPTNVEDEAAKVHQEFWPKHLGKV